MKLKTITSHTYMSAMVALLTFPAAWAHDDHRGSHSEDNSSRPPPAGSSSVSTYFAFTRHTGIIYAHIGFMTIAWIFILPVAVMFSLARSRYTLALQLAFLTVNALGLIVGVIYNSSTPDLYPNNAHHKMGWMATAVVLVQTFVGLIGHVARLAYGSRNGAGCEHGQLIPNRGSLELQSLWSDHNDQVPDATIESLPNESVRTWQEGTEPRSFPLPIITQWYQGVHGSWLMAPARRNILRKSFSMLSRLTWFLNAGYDAVDRLILPFGFAVFCTGAATYGGLFVGHGIYGGLAHWIKGGVFFWLGLITLGRWAGAFADLGWAWNVRPKSPGKRWRTSAELLESSLIFLYGSTNIFLEHLGGWGGQWTPRDLEHVAITILFIGGGLSGMIIESARVRYLLITTLRDFVSSSERSDNNRQQQQISDAYATSLNPIPALVIFLLGSMMGSHHQASMLSTMIHKQWGNLLVGASIMRIFTYTLVYLKPPQSTIPSRPPTELITAFCLIAGGVIFMCSAGDVISGMAKYGLDAMFIYTLSMGLVGFLMAWELFVLAVKGWAYDVPAAV